MGSPRSAGFSMMNCAPARWVAVRKTAVRRVISFARRSSRWWFAGTSLLPRMWFRVRTTGGPRSRPGLTAVKCLATEYVLHGGAAKTAA